MTLGRTSSGAIKIKTDGGLRVVSCGCCGEVRCPCEVAIPETLQEIVANSSINSFTMFGFYPDEFYPPGTGNASENEWIAYWYKGFWVADDPENDPGPHLFAGMIYDITTGCLRWYDYAIEWAEGTGGTELPYGIADFGLVADCADPELVAQGTFTINGEGEFPYYYYIDEGYIPVPPPNFVFT